MSHDPELPAAILVNSVEQEADGEVSATVETPHRLSRRIAIILIVINVVLVLGASLAQVSIWNWTGNVEVASFVGVFVGLPTAASLALVCVISAWGPGPVWLRGLTLVAVVVIYPVCFALVETFSDHYFARYTRDFFSRTNGLQIASSIGNALSLAIPMTMILILIGAFLRLRLGAPSLGPVRIRIIGLMVSTALLAVLVVANAAIQHLYFEEMFRNSLADFASAENQRIQTMVIMAISAPIAAIVVALAAWSQTSHIAKLIIFLLLSGLVSILAVMQFNDYLSIAALILGAIVGVIWITCNLWLIGKAGWPLTRRVAI